MPDNKDQEGLKEDIQSFLNAHRKAVFAILDKQGFPTTSLMLYAIDDDLNVYFGTRRSYGKYSDIRQHPVVSLSVVEESVDPRKVVDIRGTVIEIPEEECGKTCSFFKTKNPSKYYIENENDFVMFKLIPSFVRLADSTGGELTIRDFSLTSVTSEV